MSKRATLTQPKATKRALPARREAQRHPALEPDFTKRLAKAFHEAKKKALADK